MDNELREAKRAHNFIWTAADNYELEPLFLAFAPDGTADMYLNMIIGLTYKWYEQSKIDDFFNQLAGKDKELYEGLFWIGLENAVYQKEIGIRPALKELRYDYAKDNMQRFRKHKEYSLIDRIRNSYCSEIAGVPLEQNSKEQEILHAFLYTKDMTIDDVIEKTRENFWKYFSYRPAKKAEKNGVYFMQKVVGAFHSVGKVSATYVRAKNYDDADTSGDGKAVKLEHGKHYMMQFSVHQDEKAAKQYVEGCFGRSMYTQTQQIEIEKKLCIGNHSNCHLLFTRGVPVAEIENRRDKREVLEFQNESREQYQKNKKHYEDNHDIYRNCIVKLTEKLRICLEEPDEAFPEDSSHGNINPSKVWRAVYLGNPRVFERKEKVEIPGFSVDILIDASSSRKQMQRQIAAQGYILAKSLEKCGIPAQVYSYCSIRGYTVMRIFKEYDEPIKDDEMFWYIAAGNNRDGLAFRAAGHLMDQANGMQKILLVLTDASPQDDKEMGEGAFYKNKEYTDMAAVQDTAKEVQKLKNEGIRVVGIFMGSMRDGETAGRIFGRQLVRIKNISEFSDAVGRVLQEAINGMEV